MILEKIAQKIAENTSEIIGYPISITDKKGYIIGSSDKKRLGTFHPASIEVLKRKEIVCYDMNDELLENVLPGSAVPIISNKEFIGVLGIVGNPTEVRKYSQMIKSYVEMMCQESLKQELHTFEEKKIEALIHHLIHNLESEEDERIMRYAEILGYNLEQNRTCLLIDVDILSLRCAGSQDEENTLQLQKDIMQDLRYYLIDHQQDLLSSLTIEQFILLKTNHPSEDDNACFLKIRNQFQRFHQYIQDKYHSDASIAIGAIKQGIPGIRDSYQDALKALTVGKKTSISPRVYQYNDLNITLELLTKGINPYIQKQLTQNLQAFFVHDKYETLSNTFLTYCKCNMNLSETARELYLHRNSLVYRLEKISTLTSLNINHFDQCLLLYFAIKTHQKQ